MLRGLKLPEGVKLNRGNRESALEKYPRPWLKFEGDDTVLENLYHRKPNTINVVVYLGGGDRPQGGGVSLALQENGRLSSTDYIYGSSTGAAVASHAVTGEAEKNKRMYRLLTAQGVFKESVFGIPYTVKGDTLRDVAEGELGRIKINREKEEEGPELIVAVTDWENGNLEFYDAKRGPHAMDARFASANAPTPNQLKGVVIDGRAKTDGMIANPFPIKEIVQDIREKTALSGRTEPYSLSVCVVMNTQEAIAKYGRSMAMELYMRATHPSPTAKKVQDNQEIFTQELDWVRAQIEEGGEGKTDDRFLLTWSTHNPPMLRLNQAESKVLFEGAESDFSEALKKAEERAESKK